MLDAIENDNLLDFFIGRKTVFIQYVRSAFAVCSCFVFSFLCLPEESKMSDFLITGAIIVASGLLAFLLPKKALKYNAEIYFALYGIILFQHACGDIIVLFRYGVLFALAIVFTKLYSKTFVIKDDNDGENESSGNKKSTFVLLIAIIVFMLPLIPKESEKLDNTVVFIVALFAFFECAIKLYMHYFAVTLLSEETGPHANEMVALLSTAIVIAFSVMIRDNYFWLSVPIQCLNAFSVTVLFRKYLAEVEWARIYAEITDEYLDDLFG